MASRATVEKTNTKDNMINPANGRRRNWQAILNRKLIPLFGDDDVTTLLNETDYASSCRESWK